MNTYIDYNQILCQLQTAQFQRDWDLIIAVIQNLQHLIALEEQQQMIQEYDDQLNVDEE